MFRILFTAFGCVLFASLCLLAEEARPKSPLSKVALKEGDCIVFLGDSITGQCLYTQYVEDYFYTRYPSLRLHLHNAGVSGDTLANALVRFDRDVAAYNPTYVLVLLGMNDGAGKVFDDKLFLTYQADMRKLVKKIQDVQAIPILMSPTMYDAYSARVNPKPDSRGRGGYYNGVLALYGAWLRDLAVEGGFGFVDLYGPLNQFTFHSRKTDPKFTLIPDGIHPDPNGQILMAYSLISDLGLSKRVSTIDISRSKTNDAVAKVTGGEVKEAAYTKNGIEFIFYPASLPMSVPEAAKAGAAMIPLGHRLSYEALYIHDLTAGIYQIAINDIVIGEYPSSVLESKLEIENNERTPQYQQAVKVAQLNAQRNEQIIVPLRDLWRAKKTLDRTYEEQKQAQDDETLKKRIDAYERKLADFDGQIKVFDAKSQAIEDEIYRMNQPVPLRFRVIKK